MNNDDPRSALFPVAQALDALGVSWFVTVSLATSIHGLPRSTNDVDVLVAWTPEQASRLVSLLSDAYYADAHMLEDSCRRSIASNVIHLGTMMKIDLVPPRMPFDNDAMQRRLRENIGDPDSAARSIAVATAEDAILAKLVWFRRGGEKSDRQLSDIRGVFSVQGPALDLDYLRQWASVAGVSDLLERIVLPTS